MYKCTSSHAEDITGGRTLAPGDYADIDEEDAHNKVLIDEGKLTAVPDGVQIPEPPTEQGPAEVDSQAEPAEADQSSAEQPEKPDDKKAAKGAK